MNTATSLYEQKKTSYNILFYTVIASMVGAWLLDSKGAKSTFGMVAGWGAVGGIVASNLYSWHAASSMPATAESAQPPGRLGAAPSVLYQPLGVRYPH